MRNNNVAINVNQHVVINSAEVSSNRNGNVSINFSNLAYGNIIAIMFEAKGYDIFGNLVKVDGKDSFDLSVKDNIFVEKNASYNVMEKLPCNDICRVELQEKTIVYSDGSSQSYGDENSVVFDVYEFEDDDNEKEALSFLRNTVSTSINYIPLNKDKDYWLCGCGRHNSIADGNCTKCNTAKDVIDNLQKLLVIKNLPGSNKKVAMTKERDKINSREKLRKHYTLFTSVACIMLFLSLVSCTKGSESDNESSQDEVGFRVCKESVKGTYVNITPEYGRRTVIIDDEQGVIIGQKGQYDVGGRTFQIDWKAFEGGDDQIFDDYYVSGHGNIVNGSDVYEKISE